MDIACPHCAATYRVPEALVAGGKALRCAACGREWVPGAPAGPAPSATAPGPASAQPDERTAAPRLPADPSLPANGLLPPPPGDPPPLLPRREPGQRAPEERARATALLPLAWIASIAAVALGLAALYLYRAPIAAAWPPFGRLF